MSVIAILFSIYFLLVNIVAGAIYVFGQQRAGLLWFEYPFIYAPWLVLVAMLGDFSSLPGFEGAERSLKYFLMMVQGVSCGILGGSILLPRLFIRSEGVLQKIKVTVISSIAVCILYFITRLLLLQMLHWVLDHR